MLLHHTSLKNNFIPPLSTRLTLIRKQTDEKERESEKTQRERETEAMMILQESTAAGGMYISMSYVKEQKLLCVRLLELTRHSLLTGIFKTYCSLHQYEGREGFAQSE